MVAEKEEEGEMDVEEEGAVAPTPFNPLEQRLGATLSPPHRPKPSQRQDQANQKLSKINP